MSLCFIAVEVYKGRYDVSKGIVAGQGMMAQRRNSHETWNPTPDRLLSRGLSGLRVPAEHLAPPVSTSQQPFELLKIRIIAYKHSIAFAHAIIADKDRGRNCFSYKSECIQILDSALARVQPSDFLEHLLVTSALKGFLDFVIRGNDNSVVRIRRI
jgi:hypothetical protein